MTALVKLQRNLLMTDAKRPHKYAPPNIGRAERQFNQSLQYVAYHTGWLIKSYERGQQELYDPLMQMLKAYAEAITPWAKSVSKRMLMEVNGESVKSWRALSKSISTQLHKDITSTPVGDVMRGLLDEQVDLIKSIPTKAGERVHELTLKGLENSERAESYVAEIMRSGEVTKSRARLIARTETARTASVLTQARAQSAGITHYRWQTAEDADVRPGHKAMQGKVCEFANPPAVNENGRIMHHHPGEIWNCRCWPEPLVELE